MKRIIGLFALLCGLFGSAYAQDAVKTKAVGLVFSNLDNFGVRYYFGSEKTVFRVTALSLTGNHYETIAPGGNTSSKRAGFGLGFGVEFPKSVSEKLDFIYGLDLGGNYSNNTEESGGFTAESNTYGVGVNLVAGVVYNVNPDFAVGFELLPGVNYSYSKSGDTELKNLTFGLTNNNAAITVRYRF